MNTKERKTSRGFLYHNRYSGYVYRLFSPFLGNLLSLLPAILSGCADSAGNYCPFAEIPVSKTTEPASQAGVSTLDIFVFSDDRLQKIDCYQRFDDMAGWRDAVVSSSGKRIVSALGNSPFKEDDWFTVRSRSYLEKVSVNLEDESRDRPVMFGEIRLNTRRDTAVSNLPLRPLASEIRLNSIRCDFSGKAYEGERLHDVRVYLINVNAETGILEEEGASPKRIINAGRLKEEDMDNFRSRDLLVQDISGDIGEREVYPDISLWCYQSCHLTEGPGSPYTRLVIEGKLEGRTYYWPVTINRETEDEPGIRRGRSYIYDVVITTKGSTDPDHPVSTREITIKGEVAQWKEKQEYEVSF